MNTFKVTQEMSANSKIVTSEDDEDFFALPPGIPAGEYRLLWKGDKLGGKLYITQEMQDNSTVYYVLSIPKEEYKFVGSVRIAECKDAHEVADVVLERIEEAYIQSQLMIMKEALKTGEVRIQ